MVFIYLLIYLFLKYFWWDWLNSPPTTPSKTLSLLPGDETNVDLDAEIFAAILKRYQHAMRASPSDLLLVVVSVNCVQDAL